MRRMLARHAAATVAVVTLLFASCGGGDDETPATDAAGTPQTEQTANDEQPSTESPSDNDVDDSQQADPDSGDGAADTESPHCDSFFSMAEVEELFAEPALVTEETNDSIGQVVCTWETIEDPENTEDFAYKLLVVQLYTGEGIPASSFFDPSIHEAAVMIDGIGDLAYSSSADASDFNFVDGSVGGALTYVEADLGDFDAPKLRSRDDIEQLFRVFHDRVT